HCLNAPRMGVPDRHHRDTGGEVHVRVPSVVEHADALAADERDRVPLVRGHDRRCHGASSVMGSGTGCVIIVPIPSGVNSSRINACSTPPSTMWARPTPLRMARTTASSFGII